MTTLCEQCGCTVYPVRSKVTDRVFFYGTETDPRGDVVVEDGVARWAERRDRDRPRVALHACPGLFSLGGDAA